MTNNQATLDKLDRMRLHGMARALRTSLDSQAQCTTDELLARLVDAEWDDRHERRRQRLLKAARFRYPAAIEEVDFSLRRNLDQNQMLRLADCRWVQHHQDLIITGKRRHPRRHDRGGSVAAARVSGGRCATRAGFCPPASTTLHIGCISGAYRPEIGHQAAQDAPTNGGWYLGKRRWGVRKRRSLPPSGRYRRSGTAAGPACGCPGRRVRRRLPASGRPSTPSRRGICH